MSVVNEYKDLLNDFYDGNLSTSEFEVKYLTKFKEETQELDEPSFEILDELFADVDAFTYDKVLLEEKPELYIDEVQLKERVLHALSQLK